MLRKNNFQPELAESTIAKGVHVKGDLICDNDVWIDGRVEGSIKTRGNVVIGPNGYVEGNVLAVNADVAGQVVGDIRAEETVTIKQSGRLVGNLQTVHLQVESGATLLGKVSMPDDEGGSNDNDESDDSNS